MVLSDESTAKFEIELVNKQVQKIKQAKKDCQTHYGKQLGCGTCKALQLCIWIDELVDTIEAMRKHIEALQAENEQLRARVAQYREALIIENHRIPDVEAFSDTPAYYHNPVDVELLRKARKALNKGISELKVHCKDFDQTPAEDACIEMHEAVVEIDRAIGGEEDD